MIDCSELPGKLRRICEGSATQADGQPFSFEERREVVARRLRVRPDEVELPPSILPEPAYTKHQQPIIVDPVPGIGDNLKAIIIERTGKQVTCGDCRAEIEKLNRLTVIEVLSQKQDLAAQIVSRAAKKAARWYQRLAATLAPGLLQIEVIEWIEKACELHFQAKQDREIVSVPGPPLYCADRFALWAKQQVPMQLDDIRKTTGDQRHMLVMRQHLEAFQNVLNLWHEPGNRQVLWQCGVTTVSWRKDLLDQTLTSLKAAGFNRPRIFVDGPHDVWYNRFRVPVTFRDNIKTHAHWLMTLQELFLRQPEADMYAVFQDDVLCSANLRQYLESQQYPENGYWNLYCNVKNDKHLEKQMVTEQGWHISNQMGQGALGLVFDNATTVKLLSSQHMLARAWNRLRRHISVDGAIVEAMKKAGVKEYVHYPSLVQHTGRDSSMGNPIQPVSSTFSGDAMTLVGDT